MKSLSVKRALVLLTAFVLFAVATASAQIWPIDDFSLSLNASPNPVTHGQSFQLGVGARKKNQNQSIKVSLAQDPARAIPDLPNAVTLQYRGTAFGYFYYGADVTCTAPAMPGTVRITASHGRVSSSSILVVE